MKTVLFAWELGGGIGHVMALRRFAARLKNHDLRLVAAVKTPDAAGPLRDLGIEVFQAPEWPPIEGRLSSATLGDTLAGLGLAEEQTCRDLLKAWDAILSKHRPELVVADYSPAAALAARQRLPLLITGNGYTVPPPEMMRFPLLHRYHAPMWDENDTLATVNKTMRGLGREPLERLPQMFAGDACVIDVFEFFDPYALQRLIPVDGAAFDRPPLAREPDSDQIVVYLSRGVPVHRDLVPALAPFAPKLMIYAPELNTADGAALERRGATVARDRFSLDTVLSRARLAIHLGGPGFAAHCMVAGVPQLVLAAQGEHELNGLALEQAGIGTLIRAYEPESAIENQTIAAMIADETLAAASNEIGEHHRTIAKQTDPVSKFETLSLTLLGL